jgi:hypothetical protein
MQRYLGGERLFGGQNIEVFNGDDLLIHGSSLITTHMPIDAMNQHPCVSNGEDDQPGGANKTTKYRSCYINYLYLRQS